MAKYIDMHCHLGGYPDSAAAHGAGIAGVVYNACAPTDWAGIIRRTNNADTFGAIGVHPWYVDTAAPGWDTEMARLLEQRPHLMVGEIGLDKNRPNMNLQLDVFAKQLALAVRLHRMAHIHCVGAWDKMLRILADAGRDVPPLLFHSFSGAPQIMDELIARYDAYFSFSASVSDTRHRRARECVKHVPAARILTESDDMGWGALIDASDAVSQIRGCDMTNILYNNAGGLLNHG